MASGFDKLANGTAEVKLEYGVKEALIASEDYQPELIQIPGTAPISQNHDDEIHDDGNLESDLKNLGSSTNACNGTQRGQPPSGIKYDFFDYKPRNGARARAERNGNGSEEDESDGDGDEDDDEEVPPIYKKSNLNENICKTLKGKGGPEEQIQQVRQQIKSTKAEIAELERMMSHIADLRHVLTSQDATGSANALNALARLSMKDFEEFKECLKDFPDSSDSLAPGPTKTPTNSPTTESSPNVTE